MATVWRIRNRDGAGWVRDPLDVDHPQITGLVAEAHQWTDEAEARRLCARWNRRRGYVPGVVVEGEATEPYRHGTTRA